MAVGKYTRLKKGYPCVQKITEEQSFIHLKMHVKIEKPETDAKFTKSSQLIFEF
jgi:hypothetical protein